MNVKIYVVTHKAAPPLNDSVYVPIQVGSNPDIYPGILRDNTGLNIANKNSSFCELTAAFWIWKNQMDADYIGLCHYRRFFNFFPPFWTLKPSRQKKVTLSDFKQSAVAKKNAIVTQDQIIGYFKKHDIVLLRPYLVSEGISASYYNDEGHRKSDWEETMKVIREIYPEYDPSIKKYLDEPGNFHIGCMMIAPKSIWNDYYSWLFPILFETDKRIILPDDAVQRRVFGYVPERLLNLYVYHNNLRIKNLGGYKITDI